MKEMFEIFSNRELASAIWILLFIIFSIAVSSTRKASGNLLSTFFSWKIQKSIIYSALYAGLIVLILEKICYWNIDMLKDTVFWFLFTALVVLYKGVDNSKDDKLFKKLLLDSFQVIVIVEFVVNMHNFSLLFELLIIPVVLLLALVDEALKQSLDDKYKISLATSFTFILAMVAIILTIKDFKNDKAEYLNIDTLKSFLSPIILTCLFLPWAYIISVMAIYETIFVMIDIYIADKKLKKYAKRRLLKKAKLNISRINKLSDQVKYFYQTISKNEINELLK